MIFEELVKYCWWMTNLQTEKTIEKAFFWLFLFRNRILYRIFKYLRLINYEVWQKETNSIFFFDQTSILEKRKEKYENLFRNSIAMVLPKIEIFMNEFVLREPILRWSYPNRFLLTLEQMQLSKPRINVFNPTASW